MKKLITAGIVFALGIILFSTFSVKVEPGYVGIKVDLYGSNKGVSVETLKTGRTFYNAFTNDIYRFPTFIQQEEFEDIEFQDNDGLTMSANVAISYKFSDEKVSTLFESYRKSPAEITREYFPMWLRNAMVQGASVYKVDEIYGDKKEEYRQLVITSLRDQLAPNGIIVDDIYFTDAMDIPQQIKEKIDAKINATQIAQQKQNELAAVEADAKKAVALAQGVADSKRISARGIADAELIQKEATAKGIEMEARALTANQNLIEWRKAEALLNWNGAYPTNLTIMGETGALPLLNLGN